MSALLGGDNDNGIIKNKMEQSFLGLIELDYSFDVLFKMSL